MISLNFKPLYNKKDLVKATKEYQEIFQKDGQKIIDAFEEIGGKKFKETKIDVLVYEGISTSGRKNEPMKLRASYPHDVKKATLIHELGHRFLFDCEDNEKELDSHQILFLILYDIWTKLYGTKFANEQVKVESGRKGIYDYEKTWKWTLNLTKKDREKIFREGILKK